MTQRSAPVRFRDHFLRARDHFLLEKVPGRADNPGRRWQRQLPAGCLNE
jgi:hypothetical protein